MQGFPTSPHLAVLSLLLNMLKVSECHECRDNVAKIVFLPGFQKGRDIEAS
jgi:hypothetical protein